MIRHLERVDETDMMRDSISGTVLSAKVCVEVLYEIGFLRKVIQKPGCRTRYRMYFQDQTINFQTSEFDIHPAFRKKFVQY